MSNLNIPKNRDEGHRLSASKDWNPVLQSLRQLNKSSTDRNHKFADSFVAKITDTGPEGDESDYTDSRYWVQRIYCTLTDSDSTATLSSNFGNFGDPSSDYIFTATNLAELIDDSHDLDVNEYIDVSKLIDKSTNKPTFHYYFSQGTGADTSLWAEITDGNQFNGFKWQEKDPVRPSAGSDTLWKNGGKSYATESEYAYMTTDNVTSDGVMNNIVRMYKEAASDSTNNSDTVAEWRFEPPIPYPTTNYKVMSVISDTNYVRWREDYVRAI